MPVSITESNSARISGAIPAGISLWVPEKNPGNSSVWMIIGIPIGNPEQIQSQNLLKKYLFGMSEGISGRFNKS